MDLQVTIVVKNTFDLLGYISNIVPDHADAVSRRLHVHVGLL